MRVLLDECLNWRLSRALNDPSTEEKALLDEALAAYARNPGAGRPWREVLAEIRDRKVS